MAACLAWGPGCAASHRSAAPIWSLAGIEKGLVELVVPRGREGPASGIIVHRPRTLLRGDVVSVGAIPVTSAVRTLIDLASVLTETPSKKLWTTRFAAGW